MGKHWNLQNESNQLVSVSLVALLGSNFATKIHRKLVAIPWDALERPLVIVLAVASSSAWEFDDSSDEESPSSSLQGIALFIRANHCHTQNFCQYKRQTLIKRGRSAQIWLELIGFRTKQKSAKKRFFFFLFVDFHYEYLRNEKI